MKVVISQPMFFPWVGFFEQIKLSDVYVHYNDVQFSKGGFTNRVQIKTPEGIRWLTVPLKNFSFGQTIDEVEIDNKQNWRSKHLELLKRSYSTAPNYLDMIQLVEHVYSKDYSLLDDLSRNSLSAVSQYFGIQENKKFIDIKDLDIEGTSSERVLATICKVGGDTYITGHGARKYLNHAIFEDAGIRVEYMDYQKKPYPQLHGDFTPFVSALDLIANVGRCGGELICSGTIYWKDFVNE